MDKFRRIAEISNKRNQAPTSARAERQLEMNDLMYIAKRQLEMKEYDELSCRHWLMFFRDPETSTTLAYDTKDAQDCYRAIKAKHPNFIFLEVRGCDTVSSAVEYAKAFRLVAKVQLWLESRLKVKAEIEAAEQMRS